MKKHPFTMWTTALLTVCAFVSCANDPQIDTIGKVSIQEESLNAIGIGEVLPLHVKSNSYWHIEFADFSTGETIRWVTATPANGMGDAEVALNVSSNRSTSSRSATIKIVTDSESAAATILLTQDAGTVGGGDGYDFPIWEMFQINDNHELSNAFIEGNVCYFDEGMILKRTGTSLNLLFEVPCHTNPKTNYWFQRGINASSWADGDAWVLEIPLKNELHGDLRYAYGSRRDNSQNATSPWTFQWSANGENWTTFDGTVVAGASDALWKTINFTIPEAKKIPAGGKLWIRHYVNNGAGVGSAANPNMILQHGICITKAEAEKTALPAMDTKTVAFAWGFDNVIHAKASYIDLPIGFMSSWNAGAYSPPLALINDLEISECYTRPGFLQVGRGDEALIARYTQGSYTIKLASRFEAMNILKSDLKLTFLASAMIDAYGKPTDPGMVIKVDGKSGATVDNAGKVEGVANNEFKEFTVYIRNAKGETNITITSADMTESTDDVRFFIDDILLTVEGEPQRPSAEDAVKASVADVRAEKGASAVTIANNIYIQARVTAVDNMPADCFAVQDADAGIFVKMAGHGFGPGDMVEVVVKDAQLATDASGLLVVTPTGTDKAKKVEVASELPESKTVSVAELKAGTYEAMLVSLPESQVVVGDLTKTMSGNITLELKDKTTTYTMKTDATASFASYAVPQKRGVIKGLAGASFLMPTSVADLTSMNSTRFGEAVYAITPIDGHLYPIGKTGDFTISNAAFNQGTKTITYANGNTIYKVGNTDNDFLFGCYGSGKSAAANMYDSRLYVTGWGGDKWEDNGLIFKIKATSVLKGNLRFGFGWFGATAELAPKNWKLMWSTDNSQWNGGVKVWSMTTSQTSLPSEDPGTEVFQSASSANAGGYRIAYFNLPEAKAVPVDGYLYLKLAQADNTCQATGTVNPTAEVIFINGFYLTTHEKGAYHTSVLPSGGDVVLAEGFDECFWGPDNFNYAWQSFASHKIPYTASEGWMKSGNVFEQPGCIRIGNSGTDATASLTTPALEALGQTPSDITVSFKAACLLIGAAGLVPDPRTITVTASSGTVTTEAYLPVTLSGTAANVTQDISDKMCSEYLRWYDCSVKVTGATQETKITLGGTGRHFFDDLIITKN